MKIEEIENDSVLTIVASGRLDSGTSRDFGSLLSERIDKGKHKIIVDFQELDYVSSAGLRVLVMAAKRLKKENGLFVLFHVGKHVREVFDICGFMKFLTLVDSKKDAEKLAADY